MKATGMSLLLFRVIVVMLPQGNRDLGPYGPQTFGDANGLKLGT